ncbi:MAG TPA: MraY family glycosyltransferase [Vicinamibacteria bacterium]|nr:MraY family glycosyltransferase [Vicinamibacteria bacterium]
MTDRDVFAAVVVASATAISALLVPVSRRIAQAAGVLDHPGERKMHERATPRLGGVAVFLAFALVVGSGHWLTPLLSEMAKTQEWFAGPLRMLQEAPKVRLELIGLLAGSTLAFLIGLLDDILGARFHVVAKAAGQILAAVILVTAGIRTSFMPWEWLNVLVTVLWVVGITNAFNLLDNMDGLSAGVALVASGVLFANAWAHGEFFIGLILAAFIGSLLGFLFFNWEPASVFLGDCGSLFIGFVMASITLLERYVTKASSTYFPVLLPAFVLAVPLIDTLTVIVIRVRQRRPIWHGDNSHLSHRLVSLGLSRRAAVGFIYLATFCLGAGAISLRDATRGETLLLLMQSVGFVALLLLLMFVERRGASASLTVRGDGS